MYFKGTVIYQLLQGLQLNDFHTCFDLSKKKKNAATDDDNEDDDADYAYEEVDDDDK